MIVPENITIEGVDPWLRKMISQGLESSFQTVTIQGNPGCGKTCAMALVYASFGLPNAQWYSGSELVDQILSLRFKGDVGADADFMRRIYSLDLLCVDDVGVGLESTVKREVFREVLDSRIRKKTVMTTNIPVDRMAEFMGPRLEDRIMGGWVIQFQRESRRVGRIASNLGGQR